MKSLPFFCDFFYGQVNDLLNRGIGRKSGFVHCEFAAHPMTQITLELIS